MLLIVLLFVSRIINSSHEPSDMRMVPMSHDALAARSSSLSEDELCDAALQTFMRKTDSDLARHIKPHLVSAIKQASSSPDSDDESASPSPKRIMRIWAKQPDSVKSTPRPELDEVVLAAVQKAFEEKEADIEHKAKKIEGMFSKKCMAAIATCVGLFTTLATSLASVYGTINNQGNCTK